MGLGCAGSGGSGSDCGRGGVSDNHIKDGMLDPRGALRASGVSATYTPGPWIAAYVGVEKAVLIGTADRSTAFARMEAFDGTPDADTQEANARLIAAAPELLEALQLAIPANVCLTNSNIPDGMIVPLDVPMGDLRKIAAAIAKATGAT